MGADTVIAQIERDRGGSEEAMHESGQPSFHVLLVDDADDIHDIMRRILTWRPRVDATLRRLESALFDDVAPVTPAPVALPDLRIDSAFQGVEAVDMVREANAAGDPYDLIFMDMRMPPGIDGLETTRRIWQVQPEAHVIICSAYSDRSIEEIATTLGVTDQVRFLTKPFSPTALKQSALMMLSQQRDRRAASKATASGGA
jgi:CheY-like chemotaxis protein